MKVTYIVPVHNVNKYLGECLNSLLKIKSEKEVIIVDDAGSEDPTSIIKPYLSHSNFRYVKNEKNLGIGFARNEAIKIMSNDSTHVYFVDADDIVDSQEIDKLFPKLAFGKTFVMKSFYEKSVDKIIEVNVIEKTGSKLPYTVWGSFWDADLVKKTPFAMRNYEDAPWIVDYFKKFKDANRTEENLVLLDSPTYFYRMRKSSLTNSKRSVESQINLIICQIRIYEASDIYFWDYSKTENIYFSYLSLNRSDRRKIKLPKFRISTFKKAWIYFAFYMQKIVFFDYWHNSNRGQYLFD